MIANSNTPITMPAIAPDDNFDPPEALTFPLMLVVEGVMVADVVGGAALELKDVTKTGTLSEVSNSNLSRRNS